MNWKLVLSLSLVSVLLSLLTIFGLLGSAATWVGLLIWVVMAVLLGKFAEGKYFMNGFMTGVIGSFAGSLLTILLYDSYVGNNPELAQGMEKLQEVFPNFDARWVTLMMAPVGAAFNGAILGLLAILGGKIFGVKTATVEEPVDDKPVEP
jgi:hypothetical protein